MLRAFPVPALLSVLAASAPTQDERVIVAIRDSAGRGIPYVLVQQVNGVSRTADDSGRVELRVGMRDSLNLVVRRIGFEPFSGWVRRSDGGEFRVMLSPLAQSLKAANILAHTNDMLVRNRFYDRMERARRGAMSAVFITPEELDLRNPPRISQILEGRSFVKVRVDRGRAMLLGAGNCPYDVLLDGRIVKGLTSEYFTRKGEQELEDRRIALKGDKNRAIFEFFQDRLSIDELVLSHSVTAIEVYGSTAAAPAELQQRMGSESCGMVVLWTGSRR